MPEAHRRSPNGPMRKREMALARVVLLAACAAVASAANWDINVGPGGEAIFDPPQVIINAGDTVTWHWQSGGHNVVQMTGQAACTTLNGGFSSGATAPSGTVFTFKFDRVGDYFYACTPHCDSGMTGAILVIPNPNVASSSAAAIQSAVAAASASAAAAAASASAYLNSVLNAASKSAAPAPTGATTGAPPPVTTNIALPKCITGTYTLVDSTGDRVIMCIPATQTCYFSTDGGASFATTPFSQLNPDTPTPSMTISSSSGRAYSVSRVGLHVKDHGTLSYALRAMWNCDPAQCHG